jgi:hypothetical protein
MPTTPARPAALRTSLFTTWRLPVGAVVIVLALASRVHGAEYFIDAAKSDAPNCGLSVDSACQTYSYWYNSGCDANGCGNNIVAGDTISFRAGTYNGDGAGGYIGLPFAGTAEAPVTVACKDAPGSCVIDGTGVTAMPSCALVGIGLVAANGTCDAVGANYLVLQGFAIEHAPAGMYTVALVSPSTDHVLIRDNTLDGAGSGQNVVFMGNGQIDHITLLDNAITNCEAGCDYVNELTNVAIVGNAFAHVNSSDNYDCNTFIGVNTGLIDGNTCHDTYDGFDNGMNSSTQLDRVIVRYNDVYGTNAARPFPISGNVPPLGQITGHNSVYKNVARQTDGGPCFEVYGGADGIDIWYNTCLAPPKTSYGGDIWLQTNFDLWTENIGVKYNLFDTKSVNELEPIVLDAGPNTAAACPPGAPCPFVKNGIWAAERGGAASCVHWEPVDQQVTFYTCDDFATRFNTERPGNRDNFRADPSLVDRSHPEVLANMQLTAASTAYIDKGDSFCHASGDGSGNIIPVTCDGEINDARYYFPDPANFYALSNTDCIGKGVRAAEGVDSGCFDVQIEGACGVRQIAVVNPDSIIVQGAPCSWTTGAMVHVPWAGAAPDVGALEFGARPAGPCSGDCNGDGRVTIDEIVKVVAIATGAAPLDSCPAADTNHDGAVSVDEAVRAVDSALHGCTAAAHALEAPLVPPA